MGRRLVGFMIDCERAEIGPAAKFWSGALGLPIEDPDEGGDGRYALLGAGPGGIHVEVQRVEHASRLHLDIEADNIDAEADAIEALGATRVAKPHDRFWVMQAHTGHRFCIVRQRDREFPSRPRRSDLPKRHHSVLIALVIDCQVDSLEAALAFWSAVLERPIASHDQDGDGRYGELESGAEEVFVLLQKVSHESRVHLDIQTDDLDAEVARLEKLGAVREKFIKRWWVMQAPTGHRFCVVRQQPAKRITENTWGRR